MIGVWWKSTELYGLTFSLSENENQWPRATARLYQASSKMSKVSENLSFFCKYFLVKRALSSIYHVWYVYCLNELVNMMVIKSNMNYDDDTDDGSNRKINRWRDCDDDDYDIEINMNDDDDDGSKRKINRWLCLTRVTASCLSLSCQIQWGSK